MAVHSSTSLHSLNLALVLLGSLTLASTLFGCSRSTIEGLALDGGQRLILPEEGDAGGDDDVAPPVNDAATDDEPADDSPTDDEPIAPPVAPVAPPLPPVVVTCPPQEVCLSPALLCVGSLLVECGLDANGCLYEISRSPNDGFCGAVVLEDCRSGLDDDGDALVDCADPDCSTTPLCTAEDCANGADDDGDSFVDCADPYCMALGVCPEVCGDGQDNDGDLAADCGDLACQAECGGCGAEAQLGVAIGNAVASGTTVGQSANLSSECGNSLSEDIAFSWSPPSAGCYVIDTFGSNFDTVLHIHEPCPAFGELYCNDDAGDSNGSALTLLAAAGSSMTIVLDGFSDGNSGDYVLNINRCIEQCADFDDNDLDGLFDCDDADCATDTACLDEICDNSLDDDLDMLADCQDAECQRTDFCREDCTDMVDNNGNALVDCQDPVCALDATCEMCPVIDGDLGTSLGTTSGTTVGQTASVTASCAGEAQSEDLIYSWSPPSSGCYVVDMIGSSFDTALHIHEPCPSFSELACNDDAADTLSLLRMQFEQGRSYLLVVDGFSQGNNGAYQLNINTCVELCDNLADDDLDGFQDCDDVDCAMASPCVPEICDNRVDDDGDTLIDCLDPGCVGQAMCIENCTDTTDNDQDSAADCADPDCRADPACFVCPTAVSDLGATLGTNVVTGNTSGEDDSARSSCADSSSSPDVVFSWTAPADGCYRFDTNGSNFDTSLHLHQSCPDFAELGCDDDSGEGVRSSVDVAGLVGGTTYLLVVDGFGASAQGDYVLNIENCP